MSEQRFVKYVNDTVKDTKTNKMYPYMGNIVNLLNEQQATISRLEEENEKLRQKIGSYEKLITSSYEGEEENLDGEFVGRYVIWEDELERWREKYG